MAQTHPEPLQPPDSLDLKATQRWFMLANYSEAEQALEQITPPFRTHPDAQEVRSHARAHAKNWDACLGIGEALVEASPDRASGWLVRAYALRYATGGGLHAAWNALLPTAERFSNVDLNFNLARYACQLSRLPEARDCLKRAFEMAEKARTEKSLRFRVLNDPDLQPRWNEITST